MIDHVVGQDGHDMARVVDALAASLNLTRRPALLIARTVRGKEVSYMEDNSAWRMTCSPTLT